MKSFLALTLSLIIVSQVSIATEVYKWKDAEGKIHFSATPPPPTQTAKDVEIKKYAGGVGSNKGNYSAEANELAEGMKKALLKTNEKGVTLNCSKAMSNLGWQFDTMLTQAKRNLANGSITQAQYDMASKELLRVKNRLSYSDCNSATGVKKSFYTCMTGSDNHLIGCGQKYDFD